MGKINGCAFWIVAFFLFSVWIILDDVFYPPESRVAYYDFLMYSLLIVIVIASLKAGQYVKSVEIEEEKKQKHFKKTSEENIHNHLKENNIREDAFYISGDCKKFIVADQLSYNFVFGSNDENYSISIKSVNVNHVIGYNVSENGNYIRTGETSLESVMASSAIGGLVFGGAGAVVGAIAGQHTNKIVKSVCIVLKLNDLQNPTVEFNFLEHDASKGSDIHNKALDDANRWFDIVSIILHRAAEKIKNSANLESASGGAVRDKNGLPDT